MRKALICIMVACIVALGITSRPAFGQVLERPGTSVPCNTQSTDGRLLQPGDYGYHHSCLHEYYKTMYAKSKCHCLTGSCRPTTWREGASGTEIMINRKWHRFPRDALRTRDQIPQELWSYEAHVCAYETRDNRMVIECVVINSPT